MKHVRRGGCAGRPRLKPVLGRGWFPARRLPQTSGWALRRRQRHGRNHPARSQQQMSGRGFRRMHRLPRLGRCILLMSRRGGLPRHLGRRRRGMQQVPRRRVLDRRSGLGQPWHALRGNRRRRWPGFQRWGSPIGVLLTGLRDSYRHRDHEVRIPKKLASSQSMHQAVPAPKLFPFEASWSTRHVAIPSRTLPLSSGSGTTGNLLYPGLASRWNRRGSGRNCLSPGPGAKAERLVSEDSLFSATCLVCFKSPGIRTRRTLP
jgi:hypothetical protein